MLRKLVTAGAVVAAMGGVVLGAAPAQADDDFSDASNGAGNFALINVQTCRNLDVTGIGGTVENALGTKTDSGDCALQPVDASQNP